MTINTVNAQSIKLRWSILQYSEAKTTVLQSRARKHEELSAISDEGWSASKRGRVGVARRYRQEGPLDLVLFLA